jgi:hypothetical protein
MEANKQLDQLLKPENGYRLTKVRLAGTRMALELATERPGIQPFVIILDDVAGFLADTANSDAVIAGSVQSVGSYGADLVAVGGGSAIANHLELFLWSKAVDDVTRFRAVARKVTVRSGPIGNLPHEG